MTRTLAASGSLPRASLTQVTSWATKLGIDMPRRRVNFAPGEFYHVYNRGVERRAIFFDRGNYLFFLRKLRQFFFDEKSGRPQSNPDAPESDPDAASVRVTARAVSVVAYCLMPNHFHLLVHLHSDDFSNRMSALQKSYSQAITEPVSESAPYSKVGFAQKTSIARNT